MLCKECSLTALLWRTAFLQSIVCWECSRGIQLYRLYTDISLWAMKASEKKMHCLILFVILPSAQCVAFSLVNCCAVQLTLIQQYYVRPHLFENTREIPYFFNQSRPCRWIKVVFQKRLIVVKRMLYCTKIMWKHDSSVSLGFKQYISMFHDICHTKKG